MDIKKRKILFIDDDLDDCWLLSEAINKISSVSVESAHDGVEALARLRERKHINDLPSLIVLDMNMPRMNGKQMLQEIKKDELLSSIPLVVFTTSANSVDKEFFAAQQTQVIVKPNNWASYSEIARKLLSFATGRS
jgi:CheY-like chemotaxis protein